MKVDYILLIFSMGLVTYLTRAGFLVLFKNMKLSNVVQISLKYIPISILSALIFPAIFIPHGRLAVSLTNPYIGAGLVTVFMVVVTKKTFISIVSGIVSIIFLRIILL